MLLLKTDHFSSLFCFKLKILFWSSAPSILLHSAPSSEIAKQAEVMNKELAGEIIVGQDPAGVAAATFNGLGQPIGLKLSDAVMKVNLLLLINNVQSL
jgi:hypothetical protein